MDSQPTEDMQSAPNNLDIPVDNIGQADNQQSAINSQNTYSQPLHTIQPVEYPTKINRIRVYAVYVLIWYAVCILLYALIWSLIAAIVMGAGPALIVLLIPAYFGPPLIATNKATHYAMKKMQINSKDRYLLPATVSLLNGAFIASLEVMLKILEVRSNQFMGYTTSPNVAYIIALYAAIYFFAVGMVSFAIIYFYGKRVFNRADNTLKTT